MPESQHSVHTTYCGRCHIYPHTRQLIFPLINHLKNWQSPYDHGQLHVMCTRIVLQTENSKRGFVLYAVSADTQTNTADTHV